MKTNQCAFIGFPELACGLVGFCLFCLGSVLCSHGLHSFDRTCHVECIVLFNMVMEGGVASFGSRKFASCHEKRDAGSVISLPGWT